jgi:hypothetical protein
MINCSALTFDEMCARESIYVQRGMYYRSSPDHSLLIISRKPQADYLDALADDGSILVYEGHNEAKSRTNILPQLKDQPKYLKSGRLTPNGLFDEAARQYREGRRPPEPVRIYRKIRGGLWFDMGLFYLVDSWREASGPRQVFRFKLRQFSDAGKNMDKNPESFSIPSKVKTAVWNRDQGRCAVCGTTEDLHFDHIIPVSHGGSSKTQKNIQLLCSKHNLAKSDKI